MQSAYSLIIVLVKLSFSTGSTGSDLQKDTNSRSTYSTCTHLDRKKFTDCT